MLDLSRQFSGLREQILQAVTSTLDSQQLILGPDVERLEASVAELCNAAHGIGCASGTDALWLALVAAGVQPGDGVITTPFSFFATVSSILRADAVPLLADIDPATYNLSPAAVQACLETTRALHPELTIRAVLPVHLYGQCADIDQLTELCATHDLHLVEDAAQAIGATWRGRPAGCLGTTAAFSFYPTKNLNAAGDAGMVTTSDPLAAERCRMLRAHGMRQRYLHEELGWNARMDGLQAAILSAKLPHLDAWNRRRKQLADRYSHLLIEAGLAAPRHSTSPADGLVLPFTDPRASHVFHQYVLRVERRDALREHLALHGIASEIYYPLPLHRQPALAALPFAQQSFPEAERAAEEVLALPIFPELRDEEQDLVVAAITDFFRA